MIKSFTFWHKLRVILQPYDAETRAQIYDAASQYSENQSIIEMSQLAQVIFSIVKVDLDKLIDRTELIKKKRVAAGKCGGAPSGNSNAAKVKTSKTTKNKQNNQKQANQANACFDGFSAEEAGKVDYNFIKLHFNEMFGGSLEKVTELTDGRKAAIKYIANKYGMNKIQEAFSKTQLSDYLLGRSNPTWKATFDWIFKEDNFIKIIEGHYDNRNNNNISGAKNKSGMYEDIKNVAAAILQGTASEQLGTGSQYQ